ncbi:MAG: polysaccharide deacetylase family protein [Candidatus Bathyarchaeia archaeon]
MTFDTEDFISENSVPSLHNILELLKKHELTGLFFITGNMAEKLSNFPATLDLLSEHQIGYHSSSHSIHPTIFEFSDVESYEKAYRTSLIRETAHINPLTGEIEGPGGIHALKALFPKKQIVAFRAPGYCWTPPHLDAMKTLGITHDFSTNISVEPISYRGITFYPFTILLSNWQSGIREHSYLQKLAFKREISVLTIHPSSMVNQLDWDLIYYPQHNNFKLNPTNLTQPPTRRPAEIASMYRRFDLLLKHLTTLQILHLLKVTPELKITNNTLCPTSINVAKCYKMSIGWAEGFGYKPNFLFDHFIRFFKEDSLNGATDNSVLPK